MERERLRYFDLVSGLFMIQIIVMHILQISGNFTTSSVFSFVMHVSFFFMPWFYFKSGYFYSTPKNGVRLYFTGKAKTLLFPFAYFTIIGFILYLPFELIEAKRSIWRIFLSPGFAILSGGSGGVGNQPIWFLLSLFFSLMGFYILDKLRLKWLIIMFPLLGFSIYYFGYNMKLPLGLQSLPLGIFFFYVGYIFKNKIEKSKYIPLVLIISMLIYGIVQVFGFSGFDFRVNTLFSGNYFIFVFSALSGLVLIYFLGKKIDYIKPINYIGENSMVYFVAHWLILFFIVNTMNLLGMKTTGYVFAGIMTVSVFLLLPLCVYVLNGKLKYLIGK